MVLLDLTNLNVTGRQAEEALGESNIVVNRNAIPFDNNPPRQASGIRLGTAAITTRGMGTNQTRTIGDLILRVLNNLSSTSIQKQVKEEVGRFNDFRVQLNRKLLEFGKGAVQKGGDGACTQAEVQRTLRVGTQQ